MDDRQLTAAMRSLCLDSTEKRRLAEQLQHLYREGALPAARAPRMPFLRYAALSLAACAVLCVGILGIIRLQRPPAAAPEPGTAACFAHPFFPDLEASALYVATESCGAKFYTVSPEDKAALAEVLRDAQQSFYPAGDEVWGGAEPILLYFQYEGQGACAAFWSEAQIIRWQCGEEVSVIRADAPLFESVAALTAQPASLGKAPYNTYDAIRSHPQEMLDFLFGDGGRQALLEAHDLAASLPELHMVWAARSDNFWVTHDFSEAYIGTPLRGAFFADDGTVVRDDAVWYVPVLCDGTVQALLYVTDDRCMPIDTFGSSVQSVLDRNGSAVLVRRVYEDMEAVYLVDDVGGSKIVSRWGGDLYVPDSLEKYAPPADPPLYTGIADAVTCDIFSISPEEQRTREDASAAPPFGDASATEMRVITTAYAPLYIIPDDAQKASIAKCLAGCDWQDTQGYDPDGEFLLLYLDAGTALYEVHIAAAGYLQYALLTDSTFENSEIHTCECGSLAGDIRAVLGVPDVVYEPQSDAVIDFATYADAVLYRYYTEPAAVIPLSEKDGQE
ncbi:MAG: hypothetical protein IJ055_02005 [Oscillospiraceae bacterium]|nr:hypothetical protein [Oscillospiraceae bacterium]